MLTSVMLLLLLRVTFMTRKMSTNNADVFCSVAHAMVAISTETEHDSCYILMLVFLVVFLVAELKPRAIAVPMADS